MPASKSRRWDNTVCNSMGIRSQAGKRRIVWTGIWAHRRLGAALGEGFWVSWGAAVAAGDGSGLRDDRRVGVAGVCFL